MLDKYLTYSTFILITQDGIMYLSKSQNSSFVQPQVFFFSQIKQNGTINKRSYIELLGKIEPYLAYIKPMLLMVLFVGVGYISVFYLFLFNCREVNTTDIFNFNCIYYCETHEN